MSAIVVREATPADWPAIAALLADLGRPDARGTPEEDAHRAAFERYLTRSDALALVAVLDGTVAGFCDLELRARLNYPTPEGWIPELIVSEPHRSGGVGVALLERAVREGAARGCHNLNLESAHWRTRAHAFYHREGWKDVALQFARRPG